MERLQRLFGSAAAGLGQVCISNFEWNNENQKKYIYILDGLYLIIFF